MSKQTGAGIQLSSSTDAFTFIHTPTTHHLTVRDGDIDITGGSGYAYSFPTASTTLVSTDQFQTIYNKTFTGSFRYDHPAGPIVFIDQAGAASMLSIGNGESDYGNLRVYGNISQRRSTGWGDVFQVYRNTVKRWSLDAGDDNFRVTNVSGSVVLSLDTITNADSNNLTIPSGALDGNVSGSIRSTETSSFRAITIPYGHPVGNLVDAFSYQGEQMINAGFKWTINDPATEGSTAFWMGGWDGIRLFTGASSRWFVSQSGHFIADGAYNIRTPGSGTFGSLESSRIYNPTSSVTLEVGAGYRLYLDDGHTNSASIAGVVWSTSDPSGEYPSGTIWCKYA